MDSSSSDSVQSSGGGGEEFDSRSDSFSAFLNSSRTPNQACADISSTIHQQPSRLPFNHQNHPSPIFDPLSNYFDIFSQSNPPATPNSLLNLDMVLSRSFTSSTSSPTTAGLMTSSPSPHRMHNQSFMPSSSGHEHSPRTSAPSPSPSHLSNVGVRNPKKRTRASRRAPTTVLTTDTSNFRAMVQEFTGIPPPPFAASPFLGNRLNLSSLFNTSSSMRSVTEPSIPYALRPFAHKVLPPSFLSSMVSSTNTGASTSTTITTTTTSGSNNTNNPTSAYNFQLPSELGLPRQSQSSTNTQNPMLTLQPSHLEPSPRYPSSSLPFFGAKSQTSLGLNSALEEFSMGHGQLDAGQLGNVTKPLHEEWVVSGDKH